MHPMHPTIKAYIIAAQAVKPAAERARLAAPSPRQGTAAHGQRDARREPPARPGRRRLSFPGRPRRTAHC
jgi:hypothetical protein